MKRYVLTDYEEASPGTKLVYDDYMCTTGDTKVPVWLRSLGHSESLVRGYWERAKGTLFQGSLPLPLKEMIVFIVSAKNGARYCSACHAQCVLNLDKDLSFRDLQSIVKSDSEFTMPEYYRSVIDFASKVADDSTSVQDEDYENLLHDGFSQEEICEIVSVIDLATMFNVYTNTLQLDLDPEYHAII